MNWIILKKSDLESSLNFPQLEQLKSAEFASPGHDILEDIISSVTARVRAEIAASGRNALESDHLKIPHELKEVALSLVLEALQARIPSLKFGEILDRRASIARETLLRVAKGELPVSAPILGIKGASAKAVKICTCRKNRINRNSMEGL